MYKQDIEISQHIGNIQSETGWPKHINCTTGKNRPAMVLEAVDLLHGAMSITNAVQSMEPEVLKNIKRSNIKLSAYAEIQTAIRGKGYQSLADMILGLPGETISTHFQGVEKLLDSGIQRILPYQLMLLHGTELNTPETRQKYGFVTRHRLVPRNFGVYAEHTVFESEEIVVATNSLSFEDYLHCRKLHLLLEIYLKEEPFREFFFLAASVGLTRWEIIQTMAKKLEKMPVDLGDLFDEFTQETQAELIPTREDLEYFVRANREKVIS